MTHRLPTYLHTSTGVGITILLMTLALVRSLAPLVLQAWILTNPDRTNRYIRIQRATARTRLGPGSLPR